MAHTGLLGNQSSTPSWTAEMFALAVPEAMLTGLPGPSLWHSCPSCFPSGCALVLAGELPCVALVPSHFPLTRAPTMVDRSSSHWPPLTWMASVQALFPCWHLP